MIKTKVGGIVALACIVAGAIAFAGWAQAQMGVAKAEQPAQAVTSPTSKADEPEWVASAPGRVEPKGGSVKIGATMTGRIADIVAKEADKVARGDILIQLDDEGTTARFTSAKVEAARAKKDRDDAGGGDSDYRVSEDDVANSELALWNSRDELDRAAGKRRNGEGSQSELDDARKSFVAAEALLDAKRNALVDLQARKKRPNPNRQEAALAAARSEQASAAALVEKTHIRSPIDGVVLKADAKTGETVAPSPDQVLATVGDTSALRVKAEVDARDVGRVKVGQQAIVRVDAFQGQDFSGRISSISPALSAPELGGLGAARRTDIDVLQIFVDLDPGSPVIPGLRVDVFFKALTAQTAAPVSPAATAAPVSPAATATPVSPAATATTSPAAAAKPKTP